MDKEENRGPVGAAQQAATGYELPALWGVAGKKPGAADATAQPAGAARPAAAQPLPDAAPAGVAGRGAVPDLPTVTAAAQATAATAAAAAEGKPETTGPGMPEPAARVGRMSKPMKAAAAMAGLVLMGVPLALSQLTGSSTHRAANSGSPTGFSQQVAGGDAGSQAANKGGAAAAAAPQQPAHNQPPAQTPGGAAPKFTAVAGPSCTNNGAAFARYGQFEDGDTGWLTNSDGFTGANCKGTFSSVPMSGDTKDDGNSTVWTFNTAPVTSGTCQISVYVPDDHDVKAVGGNPTFYTVQSQPSPNSGTIGSFSISQTAHLGEWVNAGRFPVSNGQIAVMLHTRGEDWSGDAQTNAHHAADAVKADCTG